MIETTEDSTGNAQGQHRSQHMQRRLIRLLLQYDVPLFRKQFRFFFAKSALPQIPLLQQYDRFIKLQTLSNELLEAILPRIRRQLSLKTNHLRLHEDAPTRGDIDWSRTIERSWNYSPGQPPQQFETRLRQRSMETPENVLTVAILLAYRWELQQAMGELFEDEALGTQEKQVFVSADEQAERELAASYARSLLDQARHASISALVQQVEARLRLGPNPYRDLIAWWHRFTQFHVGRASEKRATALASTRTDEKTDAWLYELWIALEFIHLLQEQRTLQPQDMTIATDLLQFTFTWQDRRFRFLYNRQLDTSTTYEPNWEHGPSSRPDYTIERERPLEVRYHDSLVWREPPVVLDAKYYLEGKDPSNTHGPIKKLLGDMTLLEAQVGVLFFPQIAEPEGKQHITRTIRKTGKRYFREHEAQSIHLYRLDPIMPFADLEQRLRSILNHVIHHLPERPTPTCQGIWLDPDTVNASQQVLGAHRLLCPKPHIGPDVFDLVNVVTDCMKNPLLCHVIDQPIVPPFVLRVTTQTQLVQHSTTLREHNDESLREAEAMANEERAEHIRQQIFTGIGRATEQYVTLFGKTKPIEDQFESWIFGRYWKQHARSLAETTRHALISGEYVWGNYQDAELQDWAAPAIQYCRALEYELRRRLYNPCSSCYPTSKSGFTLGTVMFAYQGRETKAAPIWNLFLSLVRQSGSNTDEFEDLMQRIVSGKVKEKRNTLAHGGAITQAMAQTLREIVIGDRHTPGVLCWLAEHLDAVE
jgi:hypothetical protein